MDLSLIPNIAWIVLAALGAGLVLGFVTVISGDTSAPSWPLRLLLFVGSLEPRSHLEGFFGGSSRRYFRNRRRFSFREDFLVSWFAWFLIISLAFFVALHLDLVPL